MSSLSGIASRASSRGALSKVSNASGRTEANSRPNNPPLATGSTKRTKRSIKGTGDVLKAKEEEYLRLNAELEAKTSELVKEAEELMKGNLSILSDLDNSDDKNLPSSLHSSTHSPLHSAHSHNKLPGDSDQHHIQADSKTGTRSSRKPRGSKTGQRPSTSGAAVSKPLKSKSHSNAVDRPHSSAQGQPRSKSSTSIKSRVPKVDPIRVDIDATVQRIEKHLDDIVTSPGGGEGDISDYHGDDHYHGDDILPESAEDMGPEATIRFLKAKLRVMQEEMDRLCQENREKEKMLAQTESKLKEVSEQSSKIQRSYQSMAGQVDKYKHTSEIFKHKCEGLETQLVSIRKEVDGMKGTQRKAASQHSAVEVRLNRALEETEKYKSALQKARTDSKETGKHDRLKLEQLTLENKQLEKQKTELMAAFKKQMKLIDIIKRQKMHIEAAKMLSFTEEEFVKALDWGSS